ncbi:hypothetical protein BLSTO_00038 [Blastocystis sp. subtype 1]
MHSYYARANTVFFTAVYSLAAVGVFYALLKVSKPFKGELIRFDNATVDEIMSDRYDRFVFPLISLNLAYDLRGDWDYNTRSLYAYIVVSFDGDHEQHDMIMWDKIIMSKEDAVFNNTIENRYILFNDDRSIFGKEVTISFRYQIQPTVGFQRDFVFPNEQKVLIPDRKSQ